MRRFTNIDNIFVWKHKLTIQEGYLIEWMFGLPSWASNIVIDNKVFYFASKTKACSDIPLLTEKPDTMYRYYKKLQDKGFIEIKKVESKDYVFFTEKCKDWNSSNYSDKNPNEDFNSENNPSEAGRKSENHSEENPTYSNSNNNSNLKNSDSSPSTLFDLEKEVVPRSVDVLDYLNNKKPSKIPFKPTRGNLKDIEARIKEKFTIEDFQKVIESKVNEWKDNDKMKKYIRPETLFGSKFNSYLVQASEKGVSDGSGNFEFNPTEKAELL